MSTAVSHQIRVPHWLLTYAGRDITTDISSMVLSITYHDFLGSRAGEVEVELEDSSRRWQGPWYPSLGDKLALMIGYSGEALLPCGDFEIDQLELDGPPDVLRMRCLAAYITPAMRTPNNVGFENQTLLQIAATVASKYQLEVVGVAQALNPTFARVTQHRETDLEFLTRLATSHGYEFTVRGSALIFYSRAALESRPPALTLTRRDVERFAFENRTRRVYKAAEVAYQDPATRNLITQTLAASNIPTGDTRKLIARCENAQQATLKAQAALTHANSWFTSARVSLPGTTALLAGNVVAFSGWGSFDDSYLIEEARHSLNRRNGYSTTIAACRTLSV